MTSQIALNAPYSVRHGAGANYTIKGPFSTLSVAKATRDVLYLAGIRSEIRDARGWVICKRQPKGAYNPEHSKTA